MPAPFRLLAPEAPQGGVVFASPHSGRHYPADFLARSVLDARRLRSSEDAFVDRLLMGAPRLGAPLLLADAPRAWIDLNRAADEFDPALIAGLRPSRVPNPRVAAGLGVVPRVVAGGRAIYAGKIPRAEAEARIAGWWRPYHQRLAALLAETHARAGQAILIDVHSMPHEAIEGAALRPDIVLGDRFGASARPWVTAGVEAAFAAEGLRVGRNAPFAGAYVAQAYGRPGRGFHVVQVEIDRALYMDEARIRPNAHFDAFAALMGRVVRRLVRLGAGEADEEMPLAAE
ncbi:N-formylglutamate amidohydrolase [Phaeovulum vinaykumarii]|uniref:N-formylglutamate amidohydrolase n=1 Tax=Phaeovulum vinaykumarii TaxID=407234 RepID=A0A1N7KZR8_9RHOB|nr:N-formylglutamate amidohydrolase [Phaeovulum vinaykumarii]SIS67075.1 N-formylglutamate amidohydrolase [Phaeovulum vinaykumarii]SOC00857.1 N-formylglutamate amidohydrolase [Phaeovulum vinaykumarii]